MWYPPITKAVRRARNVMSHAWNSRACVRTCKWDVKVSVRWNKRESSSQHHRLRAVDFFHVRSVVWNCLQGLTLVIFSRRGSLSFSKKIHSSEWTSIEISCALPTRTGDALQRKSHSCHCEALTGVKTQKHTEKQNLQSTPSTTAVRGRNRKKMKPSPQSSKQLCGASCSELNANVSVIACQHKQCYHQQQLHCLSCCC